MDVAIIWLIIIYECLLRLAYKTVWNLSSERLLAPIDYIDSATNKKKRADLTDINAFSMTL